MTVRASQSVGWFAYGRTVSKKTRRDGRPQVTRDPATYLQTLQQSRKMMLDAATRWDMDREPNDVVIMAGALRLMLNDGLIDRVVRIKQTANVRRGIEFCDTATPAFELPPGAQGAMVGVGGLTIMMLGPPGAQSGLIPLCQAPSPGPMEIRWSAFEPWWKKATPVRKNDLAVTREFVVCEAANTDGIHIDELLDADYHELTTAIQGLTIQPSGGSPNPVDGIAAASIRQIAWEVEHTLVVALATLRLEEAASSAPIDG